MTMQAEHDTAGATREIESGSGTSMPDFDAHPLPLVAAPATVVLRESGLEDFAIALCDEDGHASLVLGPFPEDEVVATWRGLGAATGASLVIETGDGLREEAYAQIGRLRFGGALPRRRRGLSSVRRPRFLVRRKVGRLPLRPQVHRGEREIFG